MFTKIVSKEKGKAKKADIPVIEFGHGTLNLGFAPATKETVGVVAIGVFDNPQEVGRFMYENQSVNDIDPKLLITFKNKESLHALIKGLTHIRDNSEWPK